MVIWLITVLLISCLFMVYIGMDRAFSHRMDEYSQHWRTLGNGLSGQTTRKEVEDRLAQLEQECDIREKHSSSSAEKVTHRGRRTGYAFTILLDGDRCVGMEMPGCAFGTGLAIWHNWDGRYLFHGMVQYAHYPFWGLVLAWVIMPKRRRSLAHVGLALACADAALILRLWFTSSPRWAAFRVPCSWLTLMFILSCVGMLLCRMPISDLAPVCSKCNYCLRGNVSGRCPECGHPIEERKGERGG